MAGKKTKNINKKKSFWSSKEIKRVYWILGVPAVPLLLWYFYTVATVIDKVGMTELEASLKQKATSLTERAVKEGFKLDDIEKCENSVAAYGGKSNISLPKLLGLPDNATKKDILERCVVFAKAVRAMEKMAHHKKHVFVCDGSWLDVGNEGAFHIMPDLQGRGALQTVDPNIAKFIKIRPGSSRIVKWWQIHNVGDGCIILGYSKYGSPRMRPKVTLTGK